jgi:hypothetical protein
MNSVVLTAQRQGCEQDDQKIAFLFLVITEIFLVVCSFKPDMGSKIILIQ